MQVFPEIPLERWIPEMVSRAIPGSQRPSSGHRMVQEGLNNTALSYEDRAQLLSYGEEELSREEREGELRGWRAGQGALAGGLIGTAGVRTGLAVGQLGAEIKRLRQEAAINQLDASLNRIPRVPGATVRSVATLDALNHTGMLPAWSLGRLLASPTQTFIARKPMTAREIIDGPLMARHGSRSEAIESMATWVEGFARDRGIDPLRDPELGPALRTVRKNRSPYNVAAHKIHDATRRMHAAVSRPSSRAALGLAGAALGGAYGFLSTPDVPEPRTVEESEAFLRERDARLASGGGLPLPEDMQAAVRLANAPARRLGDPRQAAAWFDLIGESALAPVEIRGHADNANWAADWTI